jgi:1,4-dihydroxy-2-naphthoyl-CoA hydrolase
MANPYIAKNKVRMHDTDMAGILYFPRQFRFAHDALEDFVESEGFPFNRVFHDENFVFVIVHAESDYYTALKVSDRLEIHLSIEHIGTSSFTVSYKIFREPDLELVGAAKTIHVTLERQARTKVSIPEPFRQLLTKFLA